jgi:phosphoenolpyruvate carboxykinase (ATP)
MSHYGLEHHGIVRPGKVHWNLPVALLVEGSIRRGEGLLTSSGALNVMTGKRTGRSPKDKWVVEEPSSRDKIWWGKVNQPISEQHYLGLRQEVQAYLQGRELFVMDGFAGADPRYTMPIRIITELAWHNLFVKQLFRRATPAQLANHVPDWVVINACKFLADPKKHPLNSETFIVVDFARKTVLIGGTEYAGEMKKSIFSVLNYVLPQKGVFPMHCSANVGDAGDVALYFGLSGTGKTTLSADPARHLIGDDEHGWSDRGVFNFEGGCYAKCINLTKEREPLIWDAVRFGSVIENVVVDPVTREPDYNDDSITENTRCAYPLEYIANAVPGGTGGHPRAIVFLACDAFGVLPAVSRLNSAQAMYHFMSGYTAKVAGTEAGAGKDPAPTFSTCFGSPFLPLPPETYARMLAERMKKHDTKCYLLNTGWLGNPFGQAPRIPLPYNRANVSHILDGSLEAAEFRVDPVFGFEVPKQLPDVPAEVLDPRRAAKDAADYDRRARDLAAKFRKNFEQFEGVSQEIRAAGPKV